MNNIDRFYTTDVREFSHQYFEYLRGILDLIDLAEIHAFVETLLDARERGATIFFIGNGGSAATASHFANDLAFGVNDYEKPFKVMSLTDNNAVLTALGNDYGYEDIFVRPLSIYGENGDVVVGISASGNSPNLIKAFEYAQSAGIRTVGLTAFDGGQLKAIADQGVHVPTEPKEYGPSEDVHMILNHLIGAYFIRLIK